VDITVRITEKIQQRTG